MIHVTVADEALQRRLPFYLAMEEWVAKSLPANDYFFTWVVNPTVICGRNQDIPIEVNLPYCKAHGIDVVRRKSGGGCVYADRGNLMVSYITPSTDVETTFARYTALVADALCSFGFNATPTGRNDILIEGRKVSGNAFYHIPGRSIAHGTMLIAPDMEHMLNAITPTKSKLESQKVKSVESRITCLSEQMPGTTLPDIQSRLIAALSDSEIKLNDEQIKEIEQIEATYYDEKWIAGRAAKKGDVCTEGFSTRIDGIGNFISHISLDGNGLIDEAILTGDFFLLSDLTPLLERLKGIKPTKEAARAALQGFELERVIPALSSEAFLSLWKLD